MEGTWEQDFKAWLGTPTVKESPWYAHGMQVLYGDDPIDKECREEANKRYNLANIESLSGECELMCRLHLALARAPKERNVADQVKPERHHGTPAWDYFPSKSPFPKTSFPAGYLYLIVTYKLPVCGHYTFSMVDPANEQPPEIIDRDGIQWRFQYDPDYFNYTPFDHLNLCVETEDVNLCTLYYFFNLPAFDLIGFRTYLVDKLNSEEHVSARRLWYWYEFLTTKLIDILDKPLDEPPFLLDPDTYFTSTPQLLPRFGLLVNHLGCAGYCPTVRKVLGSVATSSLATEYESFFKLVQPPLLGHVINHLYTGDIQASFAIEREIPTDHRVEVVRQLMLRKDFGLNKAELCNLNALLRGIQSSEYRTYQNWIGLAYIPPKPEDVDSVMDGLLTTSRKLIEDEGVDPIVAATAIAVGFVAIHPFGDGNGRLHRLLLHYVLGRKFYVDNIIAPLSIQLLIKRDKYFKQLSAHHFSLMNIIDYTIDYTADTQVVNTPVTHPWYRYSDMTSIVNFFLSITTAAIRIQLPQEIMFIEEYTKVLEQLQEKADAVEHGEPKQMLDEYLKANGQFGFKEFQKYHIQPAVFLSLATPLLDICPKRS